MDLMNILNSAGGDTIAPSHGCYSSNNNVYSPPLTSTQSLPSPPVFNLYSPPPSSTKSLPTPQMSNSPLTEPSSSQEPRLPSTRKSLHDSSPPSPQEKKRIGEDLQAYNCKKMHMQATCITDSDIINEVNNIHRIVEIDQLLRDPHQNDRQLPRSSLLDMDLKSPSFPKRDFVDTHQSPAASWQQQYPLSTTVDNHPVQSITQADAVDRKIGVYYYPRTGPPPPRMYSTYDRYAHRQVQAISEQQQYYRSRLRASPLQYPHLPAYSNTAAQQHRTPIRRPLRTGSASQTQRQTRYITRRSPRTPPLPRPRPPNSNRAYDPEHIFWIRYHKEDVGLKWDEIARRFCETFPNAGRNTIQCLQSRYYRDNSVPELDSEGRVLRDSNGKIRQREVKVRQRNTQWARDLGVPYLLVEKHPWRAVQYRWVRQEHRIEAVRILAGGEAGGAKGAKWRKVLQEIEVERYRQLFEEKKARDQLEQERLRLLQHPEEDE